MNTKTYDVYDELNPPSEEAYKALRTNIQFCNTSKNIKTLTVVSCNRREGKTAVSINLAISMARSGLKVLLVDADLRKPMIIKRLGGNDISGLSNFLLNQVKIEQIISHTSIKDLFYVSSGAKYHNSTELIGSEKFGDFIKNVREEYDMVIIDTSTLGNVIDAALISAQTDGTLIVIASRCLQPQSAKRIKEQLENANANILGVVLNKVDIRDYKLYYTKTHDFYYYNDSGEGKKYVKGRFKRLKKDEVVHHD